MQEWTNQNNRKRHVRVGGLSQDMIAQDSTRKNRKGQDRVKQTRTGRSKNRLGQNIENTVGQNI